MPDFPDFDDPQPLDGDRTWTAAFDSHDPREDDIYYTVTVSSGGTPADPFMAHIWLGPHQDLAHPDLSERLGRELAKVAAGGTANTAYMGRMI